MDYLRIESIVSNVPKFLAHKGTQVGFNNNFYAVGDICRKAELDWDRPLNATPSSEFWQALFFSSLLEHKVSECSVVVGAPHSLVDVFSAEVPKGKFEISLPDGTIRLININDVTVISECAAHALAFTNQLGIHSLVLSVGFGTIELGAATSEGIIDKSLASINFGLHQAVPYFRNELRALGYDNPLIRDDQYFHWDKLLQRIIDNDEQLILNYNKKTWEAQDLLPAANKALSDYSQNLVKHVENYFKRFDTKMPVVVTGGGTRYVAVANELQNFFKKIKYNCQIANDDTSLISAAVGYQYVANELYGNKGIGIDIGNNSVVTLKK
ncbi:MAG: hypothetical protein K2X69_01855 [Silvanigrellaceae bacterium]|jgi:hypothetical protein|nr:hypothetical protein [Silvanigrellaceae bacterium]